MNQERGILGKAVGNMVRRTVRQRFRQVLWIPPRQPLAAPCIFVANHNGWHDGYLMYHLVKALGLPSLDWIEEFGAFPAFAAIGGMPFPNDDASARAKTIRSTIRLMKSQQASLVLFAEGRLHPGPGVLPLGKSLATVAKHVPQATVVPVAIRYRMGIHERPEAFMMVGVPVQSNGDPRDPTREALCATLVELDRHIARLDVSGITEGFQVLVDGTKDVNERWDVRRAPGGSQWRK